MGALDGFHDSNCHILRRTCCLRHLPPVWVSCGRHSSPIITPIVSTLLVWPTQHTNALNTTRRHIIPVTLPSSPSGHLILFRSLYISHGRPSQPVRAVGSSLIPHSYQQGVAPSAKQYNTPTRRRVRLHKKKSPKKQTTFRLSKVRGGLLYSTSEYGHAHTQTHTHAQAHAP